MKNSFVFSIFSLGNITSNSVGTVLAVLVGISLLTGCASGPKVEEGYTFYPPLPNSPRIQYLATFSNENDVGGGVGGLGKFILGGEENASPIVKPYGAGVYDGKVYVVDARGAGYAVFNLKEEKFDFVLGKGGGTLQKPINMAIDKNGLKYITDTNRQQIVVFDTDDNYVRAYGERGQFKPSDVAVVGERLYIADLLSHNIHVLDKRTGETLFKFSSAGSEENQLFHPTNLAVKDDYIYVADTSNMRIQVFNLEGEHVKSIGKIGTGLGEFARPKGIAIDRENRLYVVDAAFENVQIFDSDGKLLLFFGEPGYERRNINLPTTVTIDYDNVQYFQKYAAPKFQLEYVILVASQYGSSKLNAFGFGKMEGMDYSSSTTN